MLVYILIFPFFHSLSSPPAFLLKEFIYSSIVQSLFSLATTGRYVAARFVNVSLRSDLVKQAAKKSIEPVSPIVTTGGGKVFKLPYQVGGGGTLQYWPPTLNIIGRFVNSTGIHQGNSFYRGSDINKIFLTTAIIEELMQQTYDAENDLLHKKPIDRS